MTPTIKTVLALILAILLFSWLLSVMPRNSMEGFEAAVPEMDQINYMQLTQNTRMPKRENMEGEGESEESVEKRLSALDATNTPSTPNDPQPGSSSMPAESMLNMSPYV